MNTARLQLTGAEDHIYLVLGAVMVAMERAGLSKREVDDFWREATAWDNEHALQTCREWVNLNRARLNVCGSLWASLDITSH